MNVDSCGALTIAQTRIAHLPKKVTIRGLSSNAAPLNSGPLSYPLFHRNLLKLTCYVPNKCSRVEGHVRIIAYVVEYRNRVRCADSFGILSIEQPRFGLICSAADISRHRIIPNDTGENIDALRYDILFVIRHRIHSDVQRCFCARRASFIPHPSDDSHNI